MKLTCVTAVYNAIAAGNHQNLVRCVKSVEKIKTEHEHLIYDGESSDGTVNLLRELEKTTHGLKVFSEKDTGLYNALNKGVRDANGEWFYVLGCDDYIPYPWVLDELLQGVLEDVDVIAGKVEMESQGRRHRSWERRRRILIGMPYGHQGMLAKTAIVREVGGFDERFRIAGDYDMVLKFHLLSKKIVFTDKTIGVFSVGGMSTNGKSMPFPQGDVIAERLKLSSDETVVLKRYYVVPFRCALKLLFHRDPTLRLGAVDMLLRRLRYRFVKIKEFLCKNN